MENSPNTRDETETWLETLGTQFVDVWFYGKRGWTMERHVEDHETFLSTVSMAMERLGPYAIWSDGTRWTLLSYRTGDTRSFEHREAAEMVAIHGG